jgi:membrane dipeptidase
MRDDMLRALATNGGVVCVNFFANFLDENFTREAAAQHVQMLVAVRDYEGQRRAAGVAVTTDDSQRFAGAWLAKNKIPRVRLKSLIDHIDHIVRIAGVEHVGLGSDSNGVNFLPEGIDSAADLPKITEALLDRGYSADDIKRILGGNVLRMFRDVERIGREMRKQPQP